MASFFYVLTYSVLLVWDACQADDYSRRFDSSNISPSSPDYEILKGNMVQYRTGDILIAGMMRVHKRGRNDHCDAILEDGIQAVETMNMVVDLINRNNSILPGIKLGTVMIDTCDIDTHALERAVNVLLQFFFLSDNSQAVSPPLFAGVVGAASSAVSIQTASLLQIFKIPQVSPWSTNPMLSNKNRFPYFFRAVPSDAYQATAMLRLIKGEGWNYFSVVYEDDLYGVQGYRELNLGAEAEGLCIAAALPIPRNPSRSDFDFVIDQLLNVKNAKAVVVFTKRTDAENLLISANANNQSRGYFQWIGSDGWAGQIPTSENIDYMDSLNGAVAFSPKSDVIPSLADYMANLSLGQHLHNQTIINPSRNPWFAEYLSKMLLCSLNATTHSGYSLCTPDEHLNIDTITTLSKMQNVADAVLSIVYSLQQYIRNVCGELVLCDAINRTAGTNTLAQGVYKNLKNISFIGINGKEVHFDKNQDGPAVYNIKIFDKYSNKNGSVLNKWNTRGNFIDNRIVWLGGEDLLSHVDSVCSQPCKIGQAEIRESSICCWQCQTCYLNQYVQNRTKCVDCPRGHIPNANRNECQAVALSYSKVSGANSLASMILAFVGVAATFSVSAVFFIYRHTAIVKACGKEQCVFVFFGTLLCFAHSFVLASKATFNLCIVARLLQAFGPTIIYSALITKTIRVVIIFQSKAILSPRVKMFLLPVYQIMTTFLFVTPQIFVTAVWFVFNYPKTTVLYPEPTKPFLACSDIDGFLLLVGLAYPSILIITCTVLATVNRNVPTGFNETQYIGFTMYSTCVIWLAFFPIYITNSNDISLKVATTSICLSLSAIAVLVCLFGYRCFIILCKPEENTSKSVMATGNSKGMSAVSSQAVRPSTVMDSARPSGATSEANMPSPD